MAIEAFLETGDLLRTILVLELVLLETRQHHSHLLDTANVCEVQNKKNSQLPLQLIFLDHFKKYLKTVPPSPTLCLSEKAKNEDGIALVHAPSAASFHF